MSFILDALKKSEHKRRAQAGGESVALFELYDKKIIARRRSLQLLMIVLLLAILLLLGVLVWQRPWNATNRSEMPEIGIAEPSVPAPAAQPPVVIPAPTAQSHEDLEPAPQSLVAQTGEPAAAVSAPSAEALQPVPVPVQGPAAEPVIMTTPPPLENQVYAISDLPTEVRRRLPPLQMALHAYNAADAAASLVQINGHLVREGTQIADNLSVDEITSNGAILRSGRYRFLLPRRGQ
ncbi:general secretion pathway protein GspB [Pelovirga terrestris]|uniref:General secretion pathway protein GspB n=1 Tax=Pelovirga terrestris TaxID=2771352 RepID=A0A8J6UPF2_9BACT|nr:general secretion pathway protein GspB [Pelovirga terrestris]MBD1400694.1 general secretion pathway protein GspB [Pelovirga terrestris]